MRKRGKTGTEENFGGQLKDKVLTPYENLSFLLGSYLSKLSGTDHFLFFKRNCFSRFPPPLLHAAPVSEDSSSDWTDIFQKLDGNSIAVPD